VYVLIVLLRFGVNWILSRITTEGLQRAIHQLFARGALSHLFSSSLQNEVLVSDLLLLEPLLSCSQSKKVDDLLRRSGTF
jgi:hypothetical protein